MILSKRTITLDINSTAIRLLMTKGKRVERWASASLEPGLVEGGLISDPPALGNRVKQLMEFSKIRGKKVIASLSGLYSVSRILNVPKLAEQLTQQAVLQAAKEIMPVPLEELYLKWWVVAEDETEHQALILGMPRNLVDAEMQALKSVGIKPYDLRLKGMALMRMVDWQQALIVNMEPDSLDIVLVVDGIPQIMRTIAQQQNIPTEDWVEHLVQNLEQTTYFYDSRHPQSPLNPAAPLFLAGQLAENLDIVEMVQAKTSYPITPLAMPLEYPSNLPVPQYAVNIGLALQRISIPERIEGEQQSAQA